MGPLARWISPWLCTIGILTACQRAPGGTVITNVRLIDGTGTPAVAGAVRVVGDTIAAVGAVTPSRADTVIDGGGLVLAPGFIDTHSHHSRGLRSAPEARAAVSQGITTIVIGNDGDAPFPVRAALDSLAMAGPAVNVATYAGHGTLRDAVMGRDAKRAATPSEVEAMAALLRRELDDGAIGLSTGLEYDPGIYSTRDEVLTLAKVAAAKGTRYASHLRSEDRTFWDALDEAITIGREARLPVQVSHLKLGMTPLWGQADSVRRVLDRARAAGIDITADIYPYTFWQAGLTVLFPARDFTDLREARRVLREIVTPEGLRIGTFAAHPAYAGRTLADIARERQQEPAVVLLALIGDANAWAASHNGNDGESIVATGMDPRDVATLMAWPEANICSDGSEPGAHPRGFGAFPRVLARFVRETPVLALEEAVRKMTTLSARHVGIIGRGRLASGQAADLVLLDPATVSDRATPEQPHALSAGIRRVWVNGQTVYQDGQTVRVKAGRILRRRPDAQVR